MEVKKGKFCLTPLLKGICCVLWISKGNFPAVSSVAVRSHHQTGQSCWFLQEMKFCFVFFVAVALCAHPQPTLPKVCCPAHTLQQVEHGSTPVKATKTPNSCDAGDAVPQVTLVLPPKPWWLPVCAAPPSPPAHPAHLCLQCQHRVVLKIK